MATFPFVSGNNSYIGDVHRRHSQEIEAHYILVRKSTATSYILFITILSLMANTCYLLLLKENSLNFRINGQNLVQLSLFWTLCVTSSFHGYKSQVSAVFFSALIRSRILLFVFFVKYWKSIGKESVVIMPGLGVQLETYFKSGRRVVHRFVPIEHILKPVLNECVTPVTCYWNLGLIVRGEAELMLVFQELRPPVKMLVPVWQALCSTTQVNKSQIQ